MERLELIDELVTTKFDEEGLALVDGERELTYSNFNSWSERLAGFLLERGLPPGGKVVVLLEQSIEALVAIIGTLRAGGAYIPLDPRMPRANLERTLRFIEPDWVVSDPSTLPDQDQDDPLEYRHLRVSTDGAEDSLATLPPTSEATRQALAIRRAERSPDDMAYIIFTSGTTGVPKGVMVSHRSAMNYVREVSALAGYVRDTRFLNIPPLHFDAHLIGFFCVFLNGGTTFIMGRFGFPGEVVDAIDQMRITDVTLIPTVMKMLVSRFGNFLSVPLPHLRSIMFGAETCSVEVLRQIKQAHPQVRFVHGYGPTEATCGVLYRVFEDVPEEMMRGNFSMGRPLPGTWVYSWSEHGRLISPGEEGELFIGGVQLMMGYFRNGEQTRCALVPSHLGNGEPVYRTGDFVTVSESGEYFFIGRKDDMLKIQGMIVRLSEVKSVLMDYRNVLDVLLIPVKLAAGDQAFYAFVSLKSASSGFDRKGIFEFLRKKLPAHMLPKDFIVVDPKDIPVKTSGKVDDEALLLMHKLDGGGNSA